MRSTNFCSFSARRSATAVAASFADAIATAASSVSNGTTCPVMSPIRKRGVRIALGPIVRLVPRHVSARSSS
jgi:hypothetical protein